MQLQFNGKTYNSPEEMPARERAAFEQMRKIFVDADGNGIPDFMEGDVTRNVITAFTSDVNSNGQIYSDLEDLPQDIREKVQKAFEVMQRLGIATPEVMQGAPARQPAFEPAFQPSKPLVPQEPAIQESSRTRGAIIISFLAVMLICAVGAMAALFLLR